MNDDLSKLPEMLQPQKGDTVFSSDGDWWMSACLSLRGPDWNAYATSYKDAADALVERVAANRHQLDTLVYPMAFLYRHYIELRLKEVILEGTKLLGTTLPPKWPRIHSIGCLWGHCRKRLQQIWPTGPQCDLVAVEDCIHQFAAVDPMSQTFRYPEDTNGNPHLTQFTQLNVRNLGEVVARIAGLLDGVSSGISAYIEQKEEMNNAYNP